MTVVLERWYLWKYARVNFVLVLNAFEIHMVYLERKCFVVNIYF